MAMFLDGLVSTVFEKLGTKAYTKFASILGVKSAMNELKTKLDKIKKLLNDAESKEIKSESIQFWLSEFREVVYDTEDLLDDFQVHAAAKPTTVRAKSRRQRVKAWLKSVPGFSYLFEAGFRSGIATRIKKINSTLERLKSETAELGLVEKQPDADHEKVCSYSNTTSLQLDSDLVGIDDDATKLADQIITHTEQTHSAFAIIGMGGIGKSTLARKVLDLVKKEQHFDKSIWINISRNWSDEYVLKKTMMKLVHDDDNYLKTPVSDEELSLDFIKNVNKDKSVFIVLDDVWHSEVWDKCLREPLLAVVKYSRILITTRNEKVAMGMDVSKRHFMKRMLPEDGWLLLRKNVFREGDDVLNDRLEETGKKIVERCEYIPLAIKVMAGVLKMKDKNKSSTWEDVLKSETWSTGNLPEDVKASLLLSYEDLSPQLKKCFTYFSVLPRLSTSYVREVIINLWAAEGFDKKGNGEYKYLSSEDCYDELMMRNLIQSESVHTSIINTHTLFNMHDLVYSLTLFLSKKENIYVQHSDSNIKRRHFCSYNTDLDEVPEEITKQDYLRSLFLERSYRLKTITPEVYLGHLRRLRVLSLLHTGIEKIPEEIGTLIHLKYLDLSYTKVKELPESIRNLKNLEVLRAWGLYNLHSLPRGITELINLKVFYVTWNVHSMPPGMYNLKNLRYLNNFPVTKDTSCTEGGSDSKTNIKELKGMSQLTYLVITNLERVSNKEEAEEAAMENKKSLKNLRLSWEYWKYEDQEFDCKDIEKNENVFTGIEIPINLETLEIFSFIGRKLPSHIFNANMLTVLKLSSCLYVEQLPSLGDLPELERLTIEKASSVKEIGREFFGSSKFPRLQFFEMSKMNNLEKMFEVEEGAFPCLEKLIVRECPKLKLKSLSEGWQHAKCLKFLLVEQVENLESVENLNSVSELKLKSNSRLTSIKNLPSLKIITVYDCLSLREVKDVAELNQLFVSVEVKDVDEQCIAPEWVRDMSPQPKKIVLKKHSPRKGFIISQNWSNSFDFRSKNW